ncbi:endothelin-converting enzyme 1 isoform X2 [Fopius arisanus]|uniref:Endothelin-converting enzyme 1 isoform X2 n=1 Tax=Fopius arisanus TaxID=64838 RepID=A0A9R1U0Q2_9HYME|nr:PREDICTED: endothelin-converting enzyme 1-like isoform X2 [Fopius arisanus]
MFQSSRCNLLTLNIVLIFALIPLSQSLPVTPVVHNNPFLSGFSRTISLAAIANDLKGSLDESVNPCDDFYRFTCGHWNNRHPIQEGYLIWSNWDVIANEIKPKIQSLLNGNDSPTDNEAIRKARKVYRACMNGDKIEVEGVTPILLLLQKFGGWPLIMNPQAWKAKYLSWQNINTKMIMSLYIDPLFAIEVVPDMKNSSIHRIAISGPKTVIKKTEMSSIDSDPVIQAYKEYKRTVASVLLKGSPQPPGLTMAEQLEDLHDFEKKLIRITDGEYNVKQLDEWYNLMTIDEFQNFYDKAVMAQPTARIDWLQTIAEVFSLAPEIGIYGSEKIIVVGKSYFQRLAALLGRTSQATIVNYIMWKAIVDLTPFSSKALTDPLINFISHRIGADPLGDREDDCVAASQMAKAVSYAFVKKYSSTEMKQAVTDMVENIQEAMVRQIQQSSWLSNMTKQLASDKIYHMTKLISHPDDYTAESIDHYYKEFKATDSYLENELQKTHLMLVELLRSLGKSPEKRKWLVEPTIINAFYGQSANTMLVPAGILHAPLFDPNRPSLFNYAMMGSTIGHEVSHALDTEGRRYDQNGNAIRWWESAAINRYNYNAQCFADQYSNFKLYDSSKGGVYLNGNLTLEENIADSTGLAITFNAYKNFRQKNGIPAEKIYGLERFTDDQLFFMAFGNLWCSSEDVEYLEKYANTDVHSPSKQRVNGAVSNNKNFASAFNCPNNSPMNPHHRCNIWE